MKSQYSKAWPGLKVVKNRRFTGVGSQTTISHTSLFVSAWARDWAEAESSLSSEARKRRGDEEAGEESTRTRRAEGVLGPALSTGLSNKR